MKHLQKFNLFEGQAFKAMKQRDKKEVWDADRISTLQGKIKSHVISQGATIKKVGNDFEIHLEDKMVAQVMFRDDYVGIRKEGAKFVDKFNHTEFGKIKSLLTNIIKNNK